MNHLAFCVANWIFLSTFLRGSGTKATQLTNLFCLKEPNKTVFDVWFIVFEKNARLSSNITVIFGASK
jgi:hypothetical protein